MAKKIFTKKRAGSGEEPNERIKKKGGKKRYVDKQNDILRSKTINKQ